MRCTIQTIRMDQRSFRMVGVIDRRDRRAYVRAFAFTFCL